MFDPIDVKPLKIKRIYSYSLIARTLVLSVLAVFPSISYPDDLIEELHKAVPLCRFRTYGNFNCSTIDDAFKGCSVWQSLRPEQKHICTMSPFDNRIEYHDPKLKDWPWWGVHSNFSMSFNFYKGCPNEGTFNELTGNCQNPVIILDPGHGLIEQKDGTFAYQREPSPVYKLVEDELTLQMAFKLKSLLEADGTKVFMLRESSLAPHAPVGCGVPCGPDLEWRRLKAADQLKDDEDEVLVSIHTNGAEFKGTKLIDPTAHGTLSIYSPLAPQANSQALAELMSSRLSALGLRKLNLLYTKMAVLNGENLPSTLVEVAFHTNSFRQLGQTITDEEFLHTSTDSAAFAMFQAIKDYYENK